MVTENRELRVEPAVLSASCEALSTVAEHLLSQLKSLDNNVSGMLTRWQGASGGAYGDAWKLWQHGAGDVEKGLAVMAALLGKAGDAFAAQDRAAAAETAGVHGG